MGARIKVTVFFENRIDDEIDSKTFYTDSINLPSLFDLLNEQDVERLTRLMKDNHNLKQEVLQKEREIKQLRYNLGVISNKSEPEFTSIEKSFDNEGNIEHDRNPKNLSRTIPDY